MIYLDACVVIYCVEEHPLYAPRVEEKLASCDDILCYSPLVEMECLIAPLRAQRLEVTSKFENFLKHCLKLSLVDDIFVRAAHLRAKSSLKTPDAIHVAAAQFYGCSEFWTNDTRLALLLGSWAINVCAFTQLSADGL